MWSSTAYMISRKILGIKSTLQWRKTSAHLPASILPRRILGGKEHEARVCLHCLLGFWDEQLTIVIQQLEKIKTFLYYLISFPLVYLQLREIRSARN